MNILKIVSVEVREVLLLVYLTQEILLIQSSQPTPNQEPILFSV